MRTGSEFDDFVRSRSAALLRTAYALVGDYGHAEDMVQTALLRTARHWRVARDRPESYTRKVLVNLCRDRWRWLRRRPWESILADEVTLPRPGPADEMGELIGQRSTLFNALNRLPTGQRHVIVLRFLEDQSVADTAGLLGISEGTVKSYTARALSSLRVLLKDNQPAPCGGPTEVLHAH